MKPLARLLTPSPLTVVVWLILLGVVGWGAPYLDYRHRQIPPLTAETTRIVQTQPVGFGPALRLHTWSNGTTTWEFLWPAFLLNLAGTYLAAGAVTSLYLRMRQRKSHLLAYGGVALISLLLANFLWIALPRELWLSHYHQRPATGLIPSEDKTIVARYAPLHIKGIVAVLTQAQSDGSQGLTVNPEMTNPQRAVAGSFFHPPTKYSQGAEPLRQLLRTGNVPDYFELSIPPIPLIKFDPLKPNGKGILIHGHDENGDPFLILSLGYWNPGSAVPYAYRMEKLVASGGDFEYFLRTVSLRNAFHIRPRATDTILWLYLNAICLGGGIFLLALLYGLSAILPPKWPKPRPAPTSPR